MRFRVQSVRFPQKPTSSEELRELAPLEGGGFDILSAAVLARRKREVRFRSVQAIPRQEGHADEPQ